MRTRDTDARFPGATVIPGGDRLLGEQFSKDIAPTVWAACKVATADETEAREAFLEIMAKLGTNAPAVLMQYSRRGSLESFIALKARDLLAGRMLQLLASDKERGWRAFEALFETDLRRLIQRRLPRAEHDDARREAYQTLCLAMIEADCRRLKAYNGSGSFAGYVLRMADRLIIDFVRSMISRRRLPSAVAKLNRLDQEIFKLVHWRGLAERPDVLAPHLTVRIQPAPDLADIAAALLRVKVHVRSGYDGGRVARTDMDVREIADAPESSPEAQITRAEHDKLLAAAFGVLTRAMETLADQERLYLAIVLDTVETLPAREIARLMGRTVEDIYKIRQRVLKHLRDLIADEAEVKTWRASV